MIYQKGDMWKVTGHSRKFATREEAVVFEKNLFRDKIFRATPEAPASVLKKEVPPNPTPLEEMIGEICNNCNLEPCECGDK